MNSFVFVSSYLANPYYHGRFLHFQWLLVVLSVHTTTVVFSTFSGFLLSCRFYYHGCFLHFQCLLVVLSVHTTTVVFSTFSGFLLSCRSILPRLFSPLSVASCCLADPYYHGCFLHFQWLLVVLSVHTTTVVFFTFSGFLLSCRSILPRLFSSLSVASCCLVDPYYHGCFLHLQWLLVVLSIHTTTVVFFTFSVFLLSCRSILPRLFSSLSVASCCLADPYYHGCFLHFQWLLVVLPIHTTTVVFFTFSGFLLSCRSILPRLFSFSGFLLSCRLSVASCCLVGPYYHGCFLHFQWLLVVLSIYYHGCFLHFQWLLVVLPIHTTTVVFSTFSGFLLSCRSILPRLFYPLSVASCCLVDPTTTVVFFTFSGFLLSCRSILPRLFSSLSGFLLSCRSILPRLFSPLSVASCCLADSYYYHVVFSTFSGFLLSCRSILPRSFSSLSVASCCLADPYYHGCFLHFQWLLVVLPIHHGCFLHFQWLLVVLSVHTTTVVFFQWLLLVDSYYYHGCFLHFQWLLVVLSIHTTTVVLSTFSGFLLSCRFILPRLFSSLSVASCCLVDPYYHGCFLHFQWLLVVLPIHTTTVVFSTFSGFLLSCRSYYHGCFLHFQWLLVVLSVHTTTVVLSTFSGFLLSCRFILTTVVFFTFSGFLLSCRSILPRLFYPLSVAFSDILQWLLVVLSIHTTTVVFFTFSGFLLSCRSILPRLFYPLSVASSCLADPYYHGCFLHFQ